MKIICAEWRLSSENYQMSAGIPLCGITRTPILSRDPDQSAAGQASMSALTFLMQRIEVSDE